MSSDVSPDAALRLAEVERTIGEWLAEADEERARIVAEAEADALRRRLDGHNRLQELRDEAERLALTIERTRQVKLAEAEREAAAIRAGALEAGAAIVGEAEQEADGVRRAGFEDASRLRRQSLAEVSSRLARAERGAQAAYELAEARSAELLTTTAVMVEALAGRLEALAGELGALLGEGSDPVCSLRSTAGELIRLSQSVRPPAADEDTGPTVIEAVDQPEGSDTGPTDIEAVDPTEGHDGPSPAPHDSDAEIAGGGGDSDSAGDGPWATVVPIWRRLVRRLRPAA